MSKFSGVQRFLVTCPQCGGNFHTKESGPAASLKCQVCNFAWTEVFIVQVTDSGNAAYMSRAREQHPNLSFKNHQRVTQLRALINRIGRYMEPIPCAHAGCRNVLTEMEGGLLPQVLIGGWPTTGGAPIYCVSCAKKYAVERLVSKESENA